MATTLHTAAEAIHRRDGHAVTALMQEAPTETHRPSSSSIVDVLVIGAGQAGLAVGYHLRAAGARFEVIERNLRIPEPDRLSAATRVEPEWNRPS